MSLVSHSNERVLGVSTIVFLLCTTVGVAAAIWGNALLSDAVGDSQGSQLPAGKNTYAVRPVATSAECNVFRGSTGRSAGESQGRYRLAGTFLCSTDGKIERRKAVLDDKLAGIQRIVGEKDRFGDTEVVSVFRDRVILRQGDSEEVLWMNFMTLPSPMGGNGETGAVAVVTGQLEEDGLDGFGGKRVGELSWVFRRQKLLDYYQQLRDEPQRMLKLFDSMYPVRDENRRITGYVVNVQGEKEFFDSVGFKQGDIVRAVNGEAMTNRRRAERFIAEFIHDRANAFVFEVERDGSLQKFTYQVR